MNDTQIDWSIAPEWAVGAAMESYGVWYFHEFIPTIKNEYWTNNGKSEKIITPRPFAVSNWRESWTPKPLTEPMTTKPISNTLETDALVLTHYDEYGVYKTNTTPYEDLQILARKLERERDELKRELEKLREYFKTLPTLKPEP